MGSGIARKRARSHARCGPLLSIHTREDDPPTSCCILPPPATVLYIAAISAALAFLSASSFLVRFMVSVSVSGTVCPHASSGCFSSLLAFLLVVRMPRLLNTSRSGQHEGDWLAAPLRRADKPFVGPSADGRGAGCAVRAVFPSLPSGCWRWPEWISAAGAYSDLSFSPVRARLSRHWRGEGSFCVRARRPCTA